jgi:hypothetical protein
MANVDTLGKEITALFVGVGNEIHAKFSHEDKEALESYAKNVARSSLKLQTENDPVAKARIKDNLNTFMNATRLMIARYEMIAANAVERAAVASLKLAAETLLKIVFELV